jgi:L-threonylcarbamoyladenylate synthase
MPAKVIKIDPSNIMDALEVAAGVMKDGGLVAYPTESFYALGAEAMNTLAIEWVFRAKKRRPDNPLPVILHDRSQISRYAKDISPAAVRAIEELMPGPVTLVFQAAEDVPHNLTASTGKIAIRIPEQPLMLELARLMGGPVVATSANISGTPGLTTAQDVLDSIGAGIELILDGGPTPGPPTSTLVDVTVEPPAILREGIVENSSIEKVLGSLKS